MKYTVLKPELKLELDRLKKEPFDFLKCLNHPSYFAHHFLGITPYTYQHLILRQFVDGYTGKNKRIIICKSRQIGFSIMLAMLAIWFSAYNKANNGKGTGIYNDTKVGIVSRSEKQAIKLMHEIQRICRNAKYGFPDLIINDRNNPLNKSEIHFEKGWIKCYPPTGAPLGETFDLVIVDEAAKIPKNDFEELLEVNLEPTLSTTDGIIILSSTPAGQSGKYFELFDPEDLSKIHEYNRFWFHWKICENPIQKRLIAEKYEICRKTGNLRSFDQEYNALFTADQEAFFDNADIENGICRNIVEVYEWKETPCCIGLDYGGSKAETCLTVVTEKNEEIILLFQYSKADLDENLLMDKNWENSIPNLMKRYNVRTIAVDDCVMGTRTNRQLTNEGYPVLKYNWISDAYKSERNRGYYLFRAALKAKRIRYPNIKQLVTQMKTINEVRMENYMKIKAPHGYPSDRTDSFMLSCYPFLCKEGSFTSVLLLYDEIFKEEKGRDIFNPRFDKQWDEIKNKENPYDFLIKEVK